MTELRIPGDPEELDCLLKEIPNSPAVFLLWAERGEPHLGRTKVLRRRLHRLLSSDREGLRGVVRRLEYQLTGSTLETQFLSLAAAKAYFSTSYREKLRLRMPPYVKLILTNQFPRTQIVKQLGRAKAVYFGPFRSRSTAAQFEAEFLDLFQLRRCQDDLTPAPDHPGCIYGEMGRCLRPCQGAVDVATYRTEARRVADFLHSSGISLIESAEAARNRFSEELDFEGASLMHQKLQKIEEVLRLRDEIARDVESLNAVAVVPASEAGAITLGIFRDGCWQGFQELKSGCEPNGFFRELVAASPAASPTPREKAEHLAILSRWLYSTWCDGELVLFNSWSKPPYRKLVNAAARVAQSGSRQSKPHRNIRSSPPDSPPA